MCMIEMCILSHSTYVGLRPTIFHFGIATTGCRSAYSTMACTYDSGQSCQADSYTHQATSHQCAEGYEGCEGAAFERTCCREGAEKIPEAEDPKASDALIHTVIPRWLQPFVSV